MTSVLHSLVCAFRARVAHVEAGIAQLDELDRSYQEARRAAKAQRAAASEK